MFGRTPWSRDNVSELTGDKQDKAEQYSLYLKDPKSLYRKHAESQLDCGEGTDFLSLTEPRRLTKSISLWPDLLSFDIAYWNDLQSEITSIAQPVNNTSIQQLQPGFKIKIPEGYINQLRGEWMRLYYRGRFVYGNLYSALHFILNKALIHVAAWASCRYPFQLQRDRQMLPHDANSNEPLHRESYFGYELVKNYFMTHCSDWLDAHYFYLLMELNHQLNQQTPATYIIEYTNSKGLPCVDFICKNQPSLRMVRPENFTEDMQGMSSDPQYLDFKIQQLAAKIATEIRSLGW